MAQNVLQFAVEYVSCGACITCGVEMIVPMEYQKRRRDDHQSFYCPNGHGQCYRGKSEAEKLRDQLADKERQLGFERQRAETNFTARLKAERKLKKVERRTSCGVCPECNRTFGALGRHMKTKHPDFVAGQK